MAPQLLICQKSLNGFDIFPGVVGLVDPWILSPQLFLICQNSNRFNMFWGVMARSIHGSRVLSPQLIFCQNSQNRFFFLWGVGSVDPWIPCLVAPAVYLSEIQKTVLIFLRGWWLGRSMDHMCCRRNWFLFVRNQTVLTFFLG